MTSTAPTSRTDAAAADASAVRTELVVGAPAGCPVAQASAETGRLACRVSKSTGPTDDRVVGEFELATDDGPTGFEHVDCDRMFQTETGDVYQFETSDVAPCVCQIVESLDIPISSVTARDGQLHLTFHATDVSQVRTVVDELRGHFDDVSVRRLRYARGDADERHVVVDRGRLTDRQLEVLETANRLGYFEHPRDATGTEVAEALDIAPSTYAEHLAAGLGKLVDDVLDDDPVDPDAAADTPP